MVCSKCQKKLQKTELATPAVKCKSEMYHGSPSAGVGGGESKRSATLGNAGVGKNKLLTNKAKNPYAAYSSSCEGCKTKTEQGRKYCQRCAYQKSVCSMCGKSLGTAGTKNQPVIKGEKVTSK